MHTKDARNLGETEQRIYLLNGWREALLGQQYLAEVIMAVITINSWNRLAITTGLHAE